MGMVVKVYGSLKSACTQRVLACFIEKEVEFEVVDIDLCTGQHKQPKFLALQPFGQVPVIEDGEFRLFESRAIIRYYASKHEKQGNDLLGSTAEERAIVDQWLEIEANNFNGLVYTLVMQFVILPSTTKDHLVDKKLVASCEESLSKVLDIYNERLGGSKYLAGESFTLADLTHLPGIRYLIDEAKIGHLISSKVNVKEWWDNISTRQSWIKLMKIAALN